MVSLPSPADGFLFLFAEHLFGCVAPGNVSLDQLGNPGHELLVRRSVRRWGVVVFLVIHVFLPQLLNPTGWSPSKIGSIRSHHTLVGGSPERASQVQLTLGVVGFEISKNKFFILQAWRQSTLNLSFCNHFREDCSTLTDWLLRLSKIHPAKFGRGMQSRGFSVDSHPPNGYCVDGQFIWLIMLSWSSQNDTSLYAKHNLFRQKAGYPQGQHDFKGSFSISFQTFILVRVGSTSSHCQGSTSSHCQLEPLICGFQRYLNDNWDDFKPL